MTYAYVRVSTTHQGTETQCFELKRFSERIGLHIDRFVIEKISGVKDIECRQLNDIIKDLKEGDNILCTEVSRLGRSMQIIGRIMCILLEKKVSLYTMKENYTLKEDNPMTKLILQIYGYAAETERELIRERTREGLENAKRKGKRLGRPNGAKSKKHKLDDYRDYIIVELAKGTHKTTLARRLKCNTSTLYVYMKKWNVEKDIEECRNAGCPRKWHKYNAE